MDLNRKNQIRYLTLLIFSVFTAIVSAQPQGPGVDYSIYQTNIGFQAPKIFGASPSVAALMKFEEIPVDGYSGTPSIKIPIFQSKTTSEKVNFELSLNYHPTAISAEEVAAFTGLGWSLMGGGTISRTVNGYPDELYWGGSLSDGKKVGVYYRPEDPNGNYSNAYYETLSPANSLTKKVSRYKWEAFEQNMFDTEHDLYQYNAMGISGRFYIKMDTIDSQLKVVKLDDNQHRIEVDYNGPFYSNARKLIIDFNRFTITNSEGIKYVFEEKETVTSNSSHTLLKYFNDADKQTDAWSVSEHPTAFHLTKIYDETGTLLIEYNYADQEETVTTHSRTTNESLDNLPSIYGFKITHQESGGNYARIEPRSVFTTNTTTTKTKKMNKITIVGLGVVELTYATDRTDNNLPSDSGAQTLKEIIVKNINNQQLKKFLFTYGYFDIPGFSPESTYPGFSGSGPNHLERLILSEVKEYGRPGSVYNKYELKYKPVNKPTGAEIQKDPWGYLELNENTLASKEFSTTGVLSEVTLPTGGRVVYEFEPNTYSYSGETRLSAEEFQLNPENTGVDPSSSNFKEYLHGGGIRIKEIKTYNDSSENVTSIRRYEYKDFDDPHYTTSSGSLVFQKPKFDFYYSKKTAYLTSSTSFAVRAFRYTTHTKTNNLNFLRTRGTDVGYQYIRILDISPDNEENGRTDNIFRAPQEFPELNDENFPDYSDAYNIEYPFVPFKNADFKRGQLKESMVYDAEGRKLMETVNHYRIDNESESIIGLRMAIENGEGCPYTWEFDNFTSYMSRYNTAQNNPEGNYRLCGDYPSMHIVVYPIRDNLGRLQLVSSETTEFLYSGNTETQVKKIEEFTYNEINQEIKTRSVKNSFGETLQIEYLYPPDLENESQIMEMLTAANRISEPIIVKTTNLTLNEPLSVQETVYDEFPTSNNTILPKYVFMKKGADKGDIDYSLAGEDLRISYDKYDNKGNLLQYTLANGIPVSIIWGYNDQYPIAKAEGAEYAQIQTLADELRGLSDSGDLDEDSFEDLRNQSGVMLTAYIYEPLVGVTQIIQANGLVEFYEYDDFGRLRSIKDPQGHIMQEIKYHYRDQ